MHRWILLRRDNEQHIISEKFTDGCVIVRPETMLKVFASREAAITEMSQMSRDGLFKALVTNEHMNEATGAVASLSVAPDGPY